MNHFRTLLLLIALVGVDRSGGFSVTSKLKFTGPSNTITSLKRKPYVSISLPFVQNDVRIYYQRSVGTMNSRLLLQQQANNNNFSNDSNAKAVGINRDSSPTIFQRISNGMQSVVHSFIMLLWKLWMFVTGRSNNNGVSESGSVGTVDSSSLPIAAIDRHDEDTHGSGNVDVRYNQVNNVPNQRLQDEESLSRARRLVEKRLREIDTMKWQNSFPSTKVSINSNKENSNTIQSPNVRSPMDSFLPPTRKVVVPPTEQKAEAIPTSSLSPSQSPSFNAVAKAMQITPADEVVTLKDTDSIVMDSGIERINKKEIIPFRVPPGLVSFLPTLATVQPMWTELKANWKTIKSNGQCGAVALACTEIGFLSIYPIIINGYEKITGHYPSNVDDPKTAKHLCGFSFLFGTALLATAPRRVALAASMSDWLEEQRMQWNIHGNRKIG